MKEYGLVSVIMLARLSKQTIARAVRSVREQTYENWELIIVDDGSADDSFNQIEAEVSKDKRIRFLTKVRPCGSGDSLNTALRQSRGQWIAYLDADDYWKPEKLAHQLAFMKEHHLQFCYHEYDRVIADDEKYRVTGKDVVTRHDMLRWPWMGRQTVIFDAKIVGKLQITPVAYFWDRAMWLKVSRHADCHLQHESLAVYYCSKRRYTPKYVLEITKGLYRLFRDAERKDPFSAIYLTVFNLVGYYRMKKEYESLI